MPKIAQDLSECNCGPFSGAFGSDPNEYLHKHCPSCAGVIFAEGGGGDDGRSIGGWTDGSSCDRCGEIVHTNSACSSQGFCRPCREELQDESIAALPLPNRDPDAILTTRMHDMETDLQECVTKAKSADPEELVRLAVLSRTLVFLAIDLHREVYARTRDLKPGPLFAGCGP